MQILDTENNNQNATVAVKLDKSIIKLGRGKFNDVKINNSTISREHAIIKLCNNNHVIIQDLDSRFGTLVKADGPYPILNTQYLTLQVKNTLIWLKTKFHSSIIKKLLCCKTNDDEILLGGPGKIEEITEELVDSVQSKFVFFFSYIKLGITK